MNIRRADVKDINAINNLLEQVLMVHHNGRPDLFKANAKKYTEKELIEIIKDNTRPIFVYEDENGIIKGYAFCVHKQFMSDNILTDIRTLYIDDLCVDENVRGQHIGKSLYEYVINYAKENNYYNVTLNVWSCNESAMKFYENCGLKPQKVGMEIILED